MWVCTAATPGGCLAQGDVGTGAFSHQKRVGRAEPGNEAPTSPGTRREAKQNTEAKGRAGDGSLQPPAPSELFNKQLVSRPDALPSLFPAPSPCALSRRPSVQAVGGSGVPLVQAGPGLGGQRLFLLGLGHPSWAALGSRWEKCKREHLSCSPTDVLSHHPPFSTSSRANWFPSAISVCRSGTQGITQTHCAHFVPPLSQGG